MVTMVIETHPLLVTGTSFAIFFALAAVIVIGVVYEKFKSPMPTSALGAIDALAFAAGLLPWVILGEESQNDLVTFSLGLSLVIALVLLLRIKYLMEKSTDSISVEYDAEKERRLELAVIRRSAPTIPPVRAS
jgi:hypothetical protein